MLQYKRLTYILFFVVLSLNVNGQYKDFNFNHIAYCVAEQAECISDTLYSEDALLRHHTNSDAYFIIFQEKGEMVKTLDLHPSIEFTGLHTNKSGDRLYLIEENLPYLALVVEIYGPTSEFGMIYQFSQEEIYLSGE